MRLKITPPKTKKGVKKVSNLYCLTSDVEQLYKALSDSIDEDTGEVNIDIANALQVKEEEFDKKAIAVATVQRRFKRNVQEIKDEIERLQALKKKVENVSERLENSLSEACQRLGKEKIEGISAVITFRKSTKTIVDDESLLPDEYINVTMIKKPDATKIKKAILSGAHINGAHLEETKNIQIK